VVLQPKPLMPRQAPSIASPPNSLQISSPGLIHVGGARGSAGGGFSTAPTGVLLTWRAAARVGAALRGSM
jgi:hypothetical protein